MYNLISKFWHVENDVGKFLMIIFERKEKSNDQAKSLEHYNFSLYDLFSSHYVRKWERGGGERHKINLMSEQ